MLVFTMVKLSLNQELSIIHKKLKDIEIKQEIQYYRYLMLSIENELRKLAICKLEISISNLIYRYEKILAWNNKAQELINELYDIVQNI